MEAGGDVPGPTRTTDACSHRRATVHAQQRRRGTWGDEVAEEHEAEAVETAHGRVRGTERSGIRIFRGLRCGANTAGANRFRAPQPVEPWAGVFDATAYGQFHDELMTPEAGLKLWEAFGSKEKTMHIHPGPHVGIPVFERGDSSAAFFARHLG